MRATPPPRAAAPIAPSAPVAPALGQAAAQAASPAMNPVFAQYLQSQGIASPPAMTAPDPPPFPLQTASMDGVAPAVRGLEQDEEEEPWSVFELPGYGPVAMPASWEDRLPEGSVVIQGPFDDPDQVEAAKHGPLAYDQQTDEVRAMLESPVYQLVRMPDGELAVLNADEAAVAEASVIVEEIPEDRVEAVRSNIGDGPTRFAPTEGDPQDSVRARDAREANAPMAREADIQQEQEEWERSSREQEIEERQINESMAREAEIQEEQEAWEPREDEVAVQDEDGDEVVLSREEADELIQAPGGIPQAEAELEVEPETPPGERWIAQGTPVSGSPTAIANEKAERQAERAARRQPSVRGERAPDPSDQYVVVATDEHPDPQVIPISEISAYDVGAHGTLVLPPMSEDEAYSAAGAMWRYAHGEDEQTTADEVWRYADDGGEDLLPDPILGQYRRMLARSRGRSEESVDLNEEYRRQQHHQQALRYPQIDVSQLEGTDIDSDDMLLVLHGYNEIVKEHPSSWSEDEEMVVTYIDLMVRHRLNEPDETYVIIRNDDGVLEPLSVDETRQRLALDQPSLDMDDAEAVEAELVRQLGFLDVVSDEINATQMDHIIELGVIEQPVGWVSRALDATGETLGPHAENAILAAKLLYPSVTETFWDTADNSEIPGPIATGLPSVSVGEDGVAVTPSGDAVSPPDPDDVSVGDMIRSGQFLGYLLNPFDDGEDGWNYWDVVRANPVIDALVPNWVDAWFQDRDNFANIWNTFIESPGKGFVTAAETPMLYVQENAYYYEMAKFMDDDFDIPDSARSAFNDDSAGIGWTYTMTDIWFDQGIEDWFSYEGNQERAREAYEEGGIEAVMALHREDALPSSGAGLSRGFMFDLATDPLMATIAVTGPAGRGATVGRIMMNHQNPLVRATGATIWGVSSTARSGAYGVDNIFSLGFGLIVNNLPNIAKHIPGLNWLLEPRTDMQGTMIQQEVGLPGGRVVDQATRSDTAQSIQQGQSIHHIDSVVVQDEAARATAVDDIFNHNNEVGQVPRQPTVQEQGPAPSGGQVDIETPGGQSVSTGEPMPARPADTSAQVQVHPELGRYQDIFDEIHRADPVGAHLLYQDMAPDLLANVRQQRSWNLDTGREALPDHAIATAGTRADMLEAYARINPDGMFPEQFASPGQANQTYRAVEEILSQPWSDTRQLRHDLYSNRGGAILQQRLGNNPTMEQIAAVGRYHDLVETYARLHRGGFAEASDFQDAIMSARSSLRPTAEASGQLRYRHPHFRQERYDQAIERADTPGATQQSEYGPYTPESTEYTDIGGLDEIIPITDDGVYAEVYTVRPREATEDVQNRFGDQRTVEEAHLYRVRSDGEVESLGGNFYDTDRVGALNQAIADARNRERIPATTPDAIPARAGDRTRRQRFIDAVRGRNLPRAGATRRLPEGVRLSGVPRDQIPGQSASRLWRLEGPRGDQYLMRRQRSRRSRPTYHLLDGDDTRRALVDPDVEGSGSLSDLQQVRDNSPAMTLDEALERAYANVAGDPAPVAPGAAATGDRNFDGILSRGLITGEEARQLNEIATTGNWSPETRAQVSASLEQLTEYKQVDQPLWVPSDMTDPAIRRLFDDLGELGEWKIARNSVQSAIDNPRASRRARNRAAERLAKLDEQIGTREQQLGIRPGGIRNEGTQLPAGMSTFSELRAWYHRDDPVAREAMRTRKMADKGYNRIKALQRRPEAEVRADMEAQGRTAPKRGVYQDGDGVVKFDGIVLTDDDIATFTQHLWDNGDSFLDVWHRNLQNIYDQNPGIWRHQAVEESFRRTYTQWGDMLTARYGTRQSRLLTRAIEPFSKVLREKILFQWTSAPRYIGNQYIGNPFLAMIHGHWGASGRMMNPVMVRRSYREYQTMLKQNGADPFVYSDGVLQSDRLSNDWGFSNSPEVRDRVVGNMQMSMGAEESLTMVRSARNPVSRNIYRAVFGDERAMRLGSAIEMYSRDTVFHSAFTRQTPLEVSNFRADARRRLEHEGYGRRETNAIIRRFSDRNPRGFSQLEVETFFRNYLPEGVAERMGRGWADRVNVMERAARAETRRVLFPRQMTRADEGLRNIFFYNYFLSRQFFSITRQQFRRPGFRNAYEGYVEMMHEYLDQNPETPDWLRGMIRITALPGMATYVNPTALIQIGPWRFGSDYQFEDWDGSNGPIERALAANVPILGGQVGDYVFLNPLIGDVFNIAGYSSQDSDLNMMGFRRDGEMAATLINLGKHYGWIPNDDGRVVGNPVDDAGRWIRSKVTGTIQLPGAEQKEYMDASDDANRQLLGLIIDEGRRQGLDPEDPEDFQQIMAAAEDPESDLYKAGLQRYVWGETTSFLTRLFPGIASLWPQSRYIREDGTDIFADLGEWDSNERQFANTTDPDARRVKNQTDQYYSIGNNNQHALNGVRNEIAYGEAKADITIQGEEGSVTYTADEINEMSPEDRNSLAMAFLAQYEGAIDDWQALRSERDAFLADPDNKEFAQQQEWSRAVNDYEGGPEQYWEDLIDGNPNAKRYYEGLDEGLTDDELDRALTGQNAFFAVRGHESNYRDPAALDTHTDGAGIYDPVDIANKAPAATSYLTYEEEQIATIEAEAGTYYGELEDYNVEVNRMMRQLGIDPNLTDYQDLPRRTRSRIYFDLQDQGIEPPYIEGDTYFYFLWRAEQPPGADTSIEAYVVANQEDYNRQRPDIFNEQMRVPKDPETGERRPDQAIDDAFDLWDNIRYREEGSTGSGFASGGDAVTSNIRMPWSTTNVRMPGQPSGSVRGLP